MVFLTDLKQKKNPDFIAETGKQDYAVYINVNFSAIRPQQKTSRSSKFLVFMFSRVSLNCELQQELRKDMKHESESFQSRVCALMRVITTFTGHSTALFKGFLLYWTGEKISGKKKRMMHDRGPTQTEIKPLNQRENWPIISLYFSAKHVFQTTINNVQLLIKGENILNRIFWMDKSFNN